MVECGDPTGVRCSWCPGMVVYNGHYFCNDCGRTVKPTAEMYAGLFDRRYPKGDFESHPNFDRKLYDRGKFDEEWEES